MKANIIIRMGAGKFTVDVRGKGNEIVTFDMNKMERKQQHIFRRELTKAFRESRVAA